MARDLHRAEIDRFAKAVSGAEVEFEALSYGELLSAWGAGEDRELAEHARQVAARYDL